MSTHKFKRTYVACLNCRVRKVKCDLGNLDLPRDRCARCQRERRDCVFVDLKKRTVLAREGHDEQLPPKHFSTMEGALVFLANAAGKIATDEQDKNDTNTKHQQFQRVPVLKGNYDYNGKIRNQNANVNENSENENETHEYGHYQTQNVYQHPNTSASLNANLNLDTDNLNVNLNLDISQHMNLDINHLVNLINLATDVNDYTSIKAPGLNNLNYNLQGNFLDSHADVAGGPPEASGLSSIEYIGPDGLLTEPDAEHLIQMFFRTMYPFFPHIPRFLHLPQALAGYPLLLCAILTIALRYHPVAGNMDVHDRLWLYVQRLILQTVWAEALTRLIGTVFAFLLFSEWNPRAIHWRWNDYANAGDEAARDEPAGLGALRRSHRMAWMLIGSAVRLAQDTGFMDTSAKAFVASHVAETNCVMSMSRRSMLSTSLAEVNLDHETSVDEMERREQDVRVLEEPEQNLRFTEAQRAELELLQIASLAHESLYGYRAPLGQLHLRQNLAVLDIMAPMIATWARHHQSFLVPAKGDMAIMHESFIFDYNYTQLYVYLLALSTSGGAALKVDELAKSAKYIEQAFAAANEILHVAHRVHRLKMLRFMPVRWVARIVRAVAFIVKCYLTLTARQEGAEELGRIMLLSLISVEEIASSIQRAAITLRDCLPDELHLCTRYLNVLMYLYLEMKTKLHAKAPPVEPPVMEDPVDSDIMDWFATNKNVGLDFVGPWTELIELHLEDLLFSFEGLI